MSRVRMTLALAVAAVGLAFPASGFAAGPERRVVTHVGRDELSFATGPISATPKAGAGVVQAVCNALR